MTTAGIFFINANFWHWTSPIGPLVSDPHDAGLVQIVIVADAIFNTLSALLLSGALAGAVGGALKKQRAEQKRTAKREHGIVSHGPCEDLGWQAKGEELAHRGFSLAKLLEFYHGLGTKHMEHYQANVHTTLDVV
eukprot:TRINITY_DN12229_c0_g2_i1.p1 TRINITY_DN12229_c0_g2~~TRINITY_DN12229_c0_g2_i1.p1  ORF type:complete len:135 (-),score=24.38 TRINITY_DN12229_c0_g2_i1:531-935(-)